MCQHCESFAIAIILDSHVSQIYQQYFIICEIKEDFWKIPDITQYYTVTLPLLLTSFIKSGLRI